MDVKLPLFLVTCYLLKAASGQCTFQSQFAGSTWHDATRGTLTFSTTTLTGWDVTILTQTVTTWECVDSSTSDTLVIRSQSTILYSALQIYVYLCMKLTKISDVSYYYYQKHNQELNAGSERLQFSTSSSLTLSEVCDTTAAVPTLEFHVLVKSGSETAAAQTCADTLLYHADYTYSDGTNTACDNTTDSWDVCTNTTQMTFNYTTCSQQIAYTAGGQKFCVANMASGGYQCSVVYNQDANIVSSTRRFACICSNGNKASVAPNNCTANQSPSSLPTGADGTTVVGHMLTYGTKYTYCGPVSSSEDGGGGSSIGLIVGIVIGVLIAAGIAAAVAIYCYIRHRKNKVSESEKPILTNGAVAHSVTIDETARGTGPRREKTAISAITRGRTDLDRSLIQRNATVTSIGLNWKKEKEKTNVTRVDVASTDKDEPTKCLGLSMAFLPCLKKKGDAEKTEGGESKSLSMAFLPCLKKKEDADKTEEGGESKGFSLGFLPCLKKKEGTVPKDGETKKDAGIQSKLPCFKDKETPENEENGDVSKGIKQQVPPPISKEKHIGPAKQAPKVEESKSDKTPVTKSAPPTKGGKGGKKGAKKKGKAGKGKKSQEAQTDKAEATEATNDGESDAVTTPKKEKTDLLGNQPPQMTSTPIPQPEKSQKSPVLSKKSSGKQATASVKNGTVSSKAPAVVNGITKLNNPESMDWTFLSCCFGKRSPPPQDSEDAEGPIEKKKQPTKNKAVPKTKAKAGTKKPAAKKNGGKKAAGKKSDDKVKPEAEKEITEKVKEKVKEEVVKENTKIEAGQEETKLERAKTMPDRHREKTMASVADAEKVKVNVYVPDENSPLELKDTVTVVKGRKGEAPKVEKAKSSLGLARPGSTASTKKKTTKSGKAPTKGKKNVKGGKGDGDKKTTKKKKK